MSSDAAPFAIDAATLARWRAAGACRLLDVREAWELEICGFDDAIHIPLAELPARIGEAPTDKPLVVVCHHGARSAHATVLLRRSGVARAVNLDGGVDAWARVVDPAMAVY